MHIEASAAQSKSAVVTVIVVDDSALIRALLKDILDSDPRLKVVAVAKDAFEARDLIKKHNPQVLTLDVEMPKMNGIAFLTNLMRLRPMPVVMISTLTQAGAPLTLQALELGAIDFVAKPSADGSGGLEAYRELICEKVFSAAGSRVRGVSPQARTQQSEKSALLARMVANKRPKRGFLVAIGASTGGTEAIKEVITSLPLNSPPVVVVQHIPQAFSASYAQRVDKASAVSVFEAKDGQKIERGCVYIAPGDSHLTVTVVRGAYMCRLERNDLVNRHRPSVEVLFDSVIAVAGDKAVGVLLTGMGADGAAALLRMKQRGCATIAQDEETSVVWGMPGAAVKLGAVDKILPLDKVAAAILNVAYE